TASRRLPTTSCRKATASPVRPPRSKGPPSPTGAAASCGDRSRNSLSRKEPHGSPATAQHSVPDRALVMAAVIGVLLQSWIAFVIVAGLLLLGLLDGGDI